MTTLFTRIVEGEIPCHKILEDEKHLAFLDIMPLKTGHVLVIPKRPVDYIFDLEPDELAELNKFAQKVAIGLKKAMQCKRIGVAVIGLEVPHAHIHLVPMNLMSDMDFTRPKLNPGNEELSRTAELIRANF
ncbi:MAG: HIT family protein [Flavobacteriales bacterium]|nr:HIT family protein [Flavobacteriales bacterium]